MYIVRRTQLYLDDDLWSALHAQARRQGTTISDLVREAAREHYLDKPEDREEAMLALIGIRRDAPGVRTPARRFAACVAAIASQDWRNRDCPGGFRHPYRSYPRTG